MVKLSLLSVLLIVVMATTLLSACAEVAPWQRGVLAKTSMALEPHPVQIPLSEHIHGSREAAFGSGSANGGGCGCY